MKISVKQLQGQECSLEVAPETTVSQLKDMVETQMNIPRNEQKLIMLGRTMIDDKQLKEYGVHDGLRLNLLRSRSAQPTTPSSQPQTNSSSSPLRDELLNFLLRQHMPSRDAHKVIEEFMKEFHKSVRSLSIDDVERIAKARLQEERNATATS